MRGGFPQRASDCIEVRGGFPQRASDCIEVRGGFPQGASDRIEVRGGFPQRASECIEMRGGFPQRASDCIEVRGGFPQRPKRALGSFGGFPQRAKRTPGSRGGFPQRASECLRVLCGFFFETSKHSEVPKKNFFGGPKALGGSPEETSLGASGVQALSVRMRSATSSMSHLGVEVAPQTPTLWTSGGRGSVISAASEMNTERGLASRHWS